MSEFWQNMFIQNTQSHRPETRQVGVFEMSHLSEHTVL